LARPEAKPNTASALRRGIELERRERERKIAVMGAIVGEEPILLVTFKNVYMGNDL